MDDGKIVLLDYCSRCCSTSAAQKRVLAALEAENPGYEQKIAFYKIEWDVCGKDTRTMDPKIPRRSTLVLFKVRKELGRIVAGTSRIDIKALLEIGLAAG